MRKPTEHTIRPGQTVEEAFVHVLKSNLQRIETAIPVALEGSDVSGVHQVRVGIRRLRSALTVFSTVIPRKVTKSLSRELRTVAKALDQARELDVYIEENLSTKGKKQHRKLRKIADKRRTAAYRQVRSALRGKGYLRLSKRLPDWIENRGWRKQLSKSQLDELGKDITPFAAGMLEERRLKVMEYGESIDHLDSDTLHDLRLDCKRLRYATEFFSSLYGKGMKTYTSLLKKLQNSLGTIQDTAVMTGLEKDLIKGDKIKKLSKIARELEQQRREEAGAVTDILKGRWEAFSRAARPWASAPDAWG